VWFVGDAVYTHHAGNSAVYVVLIG